MVLWSAYAWVVVTGGGYATFADVARSELVGDYAFRDGTVTDALSLDSGGSFSRTLSQNGVVVRQTGEWQHFRLSIGGDGPHHSEVVFNGYSPVCGRLGYADGSEPGHGPWRPFCRGTYTESSEQAKVRLERGMAALVIGRSVYRRR